MACQCVSCPNCEGSGSVWYAFPGPDRGGRYLGNHRCDDLDELDTCPTCSGSGLEEMCSDCEEENVLAWMRATGAEGGKKAAENMTAKQRKARATKASKAAAKARKARGKG